MLVKRIKQKAGRILPRKFLTITKQSFQKLRGPCHMGITRDNKPARMPPDEQADINDPATRADTDKNIGWKKTLSRSRGN